MIHRITETIKFNMLTNNMFAIQNEYGQLMEKLSTQKMINRPSDDPIGTNDILDYRTARASIEQYQTNITDADIWLKLTSTNLASLRNTMDAAKNIAISESGAGASPETRQSSLATLTALIDEALSLMNAKNGDNYIFSGSAIDVQPFSSTYAASSVSNVAAATTNSFNGTVSSGGIYAATENKSYVVKIVSGGTLAAATYQISSDGGQTWGGVLTNLSAPLALGDGITIGFTAGTVDLAAHDLFTVNGAAAGYYNGNNDQLNAVIGKSNDFSYNITGAEAFTGQFASAEVTGPDINADDTILLTRGATAGSWAITSHPNYPAMTITSQTLETLTIDADGDTNPDITVNLTGAWNQNDTIELSLTAGITSGGIPATFSGSGSVDLLATLNALKAALQEPDQNRAEQLIAAQVENLITAATQVLQYETQAGARINTLTVTSSNHDSLNLQITNMLADIENADLTKLITSFQMKQIAMQASYSMASKIGEMTIMDYIR
ncbi:MAG: hypothetical protein K4571_13135 [Deltaproteobacteria bacterium]